jgi:hypothetical protein
MKTTLYVFAETMRPVIQPLRERRLDPTEWLVRALEAWCDHAASEAVLVLPPEAGPLSVPRKEHRGHVTLVRPESARAAEMLVAGAANREVDAGRSVEVVTDERSLAEALPATRCRLTDPATFARKLRTGLRTHREVLGAEPRAKFEGPEAAEVEYWVRLFEGKGEDDSE